MADDQIDSENEVDPAVRAAIATAAEKLWPRLEAQERWERESFAESFRGAVIMGHAYADSLVIELLEKHMRPPINKDGRTAAIGTAFTPLHVAYRLGLLDESAVHAIERLGDLRNKCAHVHPPATLADTKIAEKARAFVESTRGSMHFYTATAEPTLEHEVRIGIGALLSWLGSRAELAEKRNVVDKTAPFADRDL